MSKNTMANSAPIKSHRKLKLHLCLQEKVKPLKAQLKTRCLAALNSCSVRNPDEYKRVRASKADATLSCADGAAQVVPGVARIACVLSLRAHYTFRSLWPSPRSHHYEKEGWQLSHTPTLWMWECHTPVLQARIRNRFRLQHGKIMQERSMPRGLRSLAQNSRGPQGRLA